MNVMFLMFIWLSCPALVRCWITVLRDLMGQTKHIELCWYSLTKAKQNVNAVLTVCCQDVRDPCSLHLTAFPALYIVFCYNNCLTVYPSGTFEVQTHEASHPHYSFVLMTALKKCCLAYSFHNREYYLKRKNDSDTLSIGQ